MYSYVAHCMRMTHLILYADAVLVDHLGHSPLTLTHLFHEYHDDIPIIDVPPRVFRGATLVAKI